MSIFFDFKVREGGRRFRRAIDEDKYDIEAIIKTEYTEQLFGNPDIGTMIEMSTLSICMINDKNEVNGFMALCDHPNVPGVHPSDWEIWIRNLFQLYYVSRNTLFIHFMCCINSITDFFLEEAFLSIFRNDVYLLYIVLVVPSRCPKDWTSRYQTFKRRNMYKFIPKVNNDGENIINLYTAMRMEFCPKLKIRRAVEEDNDDIVQILGKNSPRLQEMYGDFYISEIIGRHPEMNRKIIVAELKDQAVGVMCLNSEINYDMLQKTYELDVLRGLRKTTAFEKEKYKRTKTLLNTFGDPIMLGKWSPFYKARHRFCDVDDTPSKETVNNKTTKIHSRVNFKHQADMRQSFDHFYYNKQYSEDFSEKEFSSPTPSTATNLSFVTYLLDEDPFDYEIVNIDNRLLTVPVVLSCDFLLPSVVNQGPHQSRSLAIQDKMSRRTSIFKKKANNESQTEKYNGGPNAFMIELFGIREDIDDRQSFHLLEAAFEIMKDYDYCIIRVPCNENTFHLLQHFCFIPTKNKISSEYALYVAHRSSVLSKLRVRRAELMDIPQIANLLRSLDGRETLWTIENTILNRNQLQCYVLLSSVTIVGVGILERPEHIDFIRAKFNLDAYRIHKYHLTQGLDCGFSTLKAVIVYSVFEIHYRFFVREMMRLSGSNGLMWLTAYRNKWITHKANSLAGSMIPLMPRNSEIDFKALPELRKFRKLSNTLMAFSSWFISKKLTSIYRVNVNTRILVVGASRTPMAFLNALLFSDSSSYLFFTNVTLISPTGLPYTRRTNVLAEMMFQKYRTNSDKFLKSIPYTYYINVIQGTMVEINKRQKYIVLSSERRCDYDLLFLLFGKQYQHPGYLNSVLERERDLRCGKIPQYIRLDVPQPGLEPRLCNYTPANVFVVNTLADANKALCFVRTLLWQDADYKIIVYGASKHAYCCLATLVEMKIPTSSIVFIEPFPSEDIKKTRVSLFCNEYVDKSIRKLLDNLKIEVHRSYYFQRWYIGDDNLVTHVDFLSHFHMLQLKCSAFFYYGTRGVNEQAFIAINKSGMAYDGGILIDHQFRTNDISIYAAGPATRYRRKYYADTKSQKYYDAYEVGGRLGSQIRDQLDPIFKERKKIERAQKNFAKSVSLDMPLIEKKRFCDDSASNNNKIFHKSDGLEEIPKVPNFSMAHVAYYSLPGGLQYLEFQPPGMRVPHQYVQSLQYNAYVMETFKSGYFKLHLNKDLIVDGITCLTPEKYSLENFKNLYGLSATVLNNVHLRYTAKKLDNFYKFFRAPWAHFLYYDETKELFAMVKEILPKGKRDGETLAEGLRTVAQNLSNKAFNFDTKMKIKSNFEKSPHVEAITDYVLEWLESGNDVLLPMYLQPSQTTEYKYDLEQHPAFKRRRNTIVNMLSKIF